MHGEGGKGEKNTKPSTGGIDLRWKQNELTEKSKTKYDECYQWA